MIRAERSLAVRGLVEVESLFCMCGYLQGLSFNYESNLTVELTPRRESRHPRRTKQVKKGAPAARVPRFVGLAFKNSGWTISSFSLGKASLFALEPKGWFQGVLEAQQFPI
jgi:hypothetical protein